MPAPWPLRSSPLVVFSFPKQLGLLSALWGSKRTQFVLVSIQKYLALIWKSSLQRGLRVILCGMSSAGENNAERKSNHLEEEAQGGHGERSGRKGEICFSGWNNLNPVLFLFFLSFFFFFFHFCSSPLLLFLLHSSFSSPSPPSPFFCLFFSFTSSLLPYFVICHNDKAEAVTKADSSCRPQVFPLLLNILVRAAVVHK